MKPLIETENLTKKYGTGNESFYALNKINFKINEGEFISILGPSGSGKSTLMNIIGGLDTAESGNLFIEGKNIRKFSKSDLAHYRNKSAGFVFQSFNLNNSLTALENVMLPLIYSKEKHNTRYEKAFNALKSVGLENRIRHRPSELSGGQKQRVSIARAIVNSPRIVLADEPTGNLDTASGELIMELLKSINEKGYTIIMVTHNPMQAAYSKRTVEIIDGKIVKDIFNN